MDNDSYLLLLLSDGNLPTGSFVSSSGLESYFKHGFPAITQANQTQIPANVEATLTFINQSLAAYARLALPFASDAHDIAVNASVSTERDVLHHLQELDRRYESMTLNHVTRRASKAQGVALLTLLSKGFSRPTWMGSLGDNAIQVLSGQKYPAQAQYEVHKSTIDTFKLSIRNGESPGHLPVCWGILTASLPLSKGLSNALIAIVLTIASQPQRASKARSQQLFLFLYARSLLSSAIRLNTIGPYAAQQLLLHVIRVMVDEEVARCGSLSAGMPNRQKRKSARTSKYASNPLPYAEDEDEDWKRLELDSLPATTWPLGEILGARHDLQHSRIFNS